MDTVEIGDSPTIQVNGGSLTLRNSVVNESTTSDQPAIAVSGSSTVDLGTADRPGGNTINITGDGQTLQSNGTNVIYTVGNTFLDDGAAIAPAASVALTSSANPSLLNQMVTLTATVIAPDPTLPAPTGTVTFMDTTNGTTLEVVPVTNGIATWSTAGLGLASHVITALYSGNTNYITSAATIVQQVHYLFSGYLAPLANNLAFNQNKTIPIKWQLKDANGQFITSLNAVTSLQVALDRGDGNFGTPFNPNPTGGTALRIDCNQYSLNWNTKNLDIGTYQIQLSLADGTVQTKTVQIVSKGSTSGLRINGTSGTESTSGGLLGGNIELFIDQSHGSFTSDEWARIEDAISIINSVTEKYGVEIKEVSDRNAANVIMDFGHTSALDGFADGVLGCTTQAGEITIIQDWNWYAGSKLDGISTGQFDFQSVVTHELGHALALGHNSNDASVMYGTLDAMSSKRTLVKSDLDVSDDNDSACGLYAYVVDKSASTVLNTNTYS